MSKFGLESDGSRGDDEARDLATRLAAFPPAAPRPRIDLPEVDAAAAAHGFISRESNPYPTAAQGRRRRLGRIEPTRHLAIRLPVTLYERFVEFADDHQLTYHDALAKLLADSGR